MSPKFQELGDNMKHAFAALLESSGINYELLKYIEWSKDVKEQLLYAKWLSKFKHALLV